MNRILPSRFETFGAAALAAAALALSAPAARATWTVTKESVPGGCTHVITDGNWKIGVFQYSADNWNLGKQTGQNGHAYVAGEGVLDLRNVEADCGVVLKASNNGALEGGKPITEVWFPDSFETMLGNTFKNDTALTNVVFGSGFKTVGGESFRACSGLKSVTFNEGVETFGSYAFNGCSALELTDFTFPESLKTLGDHCFAGCTKLAGTVTFPGLTSLTGAYQFEDCTAMTAFVAPKCVTTAKVMFNRCTALTSATFSPDLETIVEQSFEKGDQQNTPQLLSFFPRTMPKLKTFGQKAFRGQTKLDGGFDFSGSSITELPYFAFVDDAALGRIKLPVGLTKIGGAALGYGKKARVVWFCGPPPAMDSDALNPKGGSGWVLVAGAKHAAEWKASENVAALTSAETASAKAAAEAFGLTGVKPIGKWTYQTGGYTHWVVEELPQGTVVVVK